MDKLDTCKEFSSSGYFILYSKNFFRLNILGFFLHLSKWGNRWNNGENKDIKAGRERIKILEAGKGRNREGGRCEFKWWWKGFLALTVIICVYGGPW